MVHEQAELFPQLYVLRQNIKVQVRTRYLRHWQDFAVKSEFPAVNINVRPFCTYVVVQNDRASRYYIFNRRSGELKAYGAAGGDIRFVHIQLARCIPISRRGKNNLRGTAEGVRIAAVIPFCHQVKIAAQPVASEQVSIYISAVARHSRRNSRIAYLCVGIGSAYHLNTEAVIAFQGKRRRHGYREIRTIRIRDKRPAVN